MTPATRDYAGVAVAAPVTFGYSRHSHRGVPWFVGSALGASLRGSRLSKSDVDGMVLASYRLAPDNAAGMAEYLGLSPRFLVDLPYGGASGVIALRRAARAVQLGDAEVVACIGADVPPSDNTFVANFSGFSRDHVYPYGAAGANLPFALITDNYARAYGVSREDFGRLCITQRENASRFPPALLRTPLSIEQYLLARPICEPLGLFDCVMRCCGAEAFLVLAEDRAKRLGLPYAGIAASVERHNGFPGESVQTTLGVSLDSERLWAQAGIGPSDVDFVQAYDDYPVIVMMQLEALGFCGKGEAAGLVRQGRLSIDGDLPINTNGGMLSLGQAGAAGGFVGTTEALRQLTGQALGVAVADPVFGVVSGYGTVNYDRGLCSSAVVLTRGCALSSGRAA